MSSSTALGKEQEYGKKLDKCITDLGIKLVAGIAVGGVFSLLFKRRAWPMTLGAGIGVGMAYKSCEYRFSDQKCENQRNVVNPNESLMQSSSSPAESSSSEHSQVATGPNIE